MHAIIIGARGLKSGPDFFALIHIEMGSSSVGKAEKRLLQQPGAILFLFLSALFGIAWLRSLISIPAPTFNNDLISLEAMQAAASVLDSELMITAPPNKSYESKYLNPCWKTQSGMLRCLPYAYVSGFQTGARALSRSLAAHPSVALDIGALFGPWPTSQSQQGYSKGFWNEYRNQLQSYLSMIAQPSVVDRLEAQPRETIVIDGSMSTIDLFWAGNTKAHRAFSSFAVDCWSKCNAEFKGSGPQYESCMDQKCLQGGREADLKSAKEAGVSLEDLQLPMLMRAVYGTHQPKFVFLLRDPVERFFSSYFGSENLYKRTGQDVDGFIKYTREQIDAFDLCKSSRNHSAASAEEDCVLRFESLTMAQEKVFYHCDQIFRGFYAMQLKHWFRFFPRSSFLVINSADFFSNRRAVTEKVAKFIGLMPPTDAGWELMSKAGPKISNIEGRVMPAKEKEELSKLYLKPNADLATLLGEKSWLKWNNKE